ncbi:MAG: leucine-rich repeat protein, partial [Lachnospiraceae bacterium]|nr:leucine-rich repeat protein [Lachnospiraceae bacterium]
YQSRMGDFLLANRQYLTEVNLKVLGSSTPERLPMNTFQGCLRLKDVVLDSAQNQLKLDANLFRSSTINELTVNGPEYATADTGRQDGAGRYYARPRMSTWACFSAVADYVPYCYPENHYEVGYPIQDDSFLFDLATEGNTASIRSCTYMGNIAAAGLFGTTKDKPFSIPDVVAGYKVSALQDGCLDSVRNNIVYLQIPDNTLTTLNSKVFLESKELKGVDIGNSVTSIGEGCFMKCEKLEEATIGEGISSIDKNCFADCPKLKHIYWDVPTVPGAVNIGEGAFKTIPSGTPASQVNALYFHGYAEDASYGPLAYAMSGVTIDEKGTGICYMSPVNVNVNGFSTPVDESEIQTYSMIMDKKTGKITLIDYPHFDDLPMDIQQKFLNGQSLTDPERTLVLESTIIQVPAAVQSIDVNSFLNNNINNLNWTYLTSEKQKRYSGSIKTVSAPDGAISENVPGLFSGTTNETAAIQAGAEQALGCELAGDATFSEASPDHDERGNDWITKVTLPRVESIPEGAFDSCERLGVVNIGEACTSVGTLAFRDCNELKTIETAYTTANPYFEFNNYILYENLTSGGKEINCCLPYRGKEMGPETSIGPEADGEYLNQVVSIHESAFAGCDRIRSADLSGTGLTRVGAGCFDGCSKLNTIKLPESITNIGDRAFTGCADGLTVTIPNMMTYITKDAFDPPSSGNVVYVRTPKDSTAYNITNVVVPENRNINWVDMVAFMVKFYNDDRVTQIGETQIIETPGTNARIPDTGNLISTRNPDAAFSHWEWANPATGEIVTGQRTVENVNEDRDIIAVYDSVTHTITFNNDDGSNITTRIVDHGDVAPVPNERNLTTKLHPGEEDQYEFSRWLVTIGGATASFDPHDDPVTADTICTAYFEKKGSGGGGSTSDNTPTPTGGGGDGTNTPTPTGGGNSGTSTPTPTGGGSGDTGTPTPTGGSGSSSSNSATGKGYFAIVENGSGSGQYPAGSVITITAYAPPAGKAFDRWTTSNTDIGISNAKAVSTTFIMPSHDVKVTATYAGAATSGNVAVPTAGPVPTRGTASGNTPVAPTPVPGGTEVRITTDAIDNNKKNLGAATVTGSNETFIVKVTDSAAATAAVEAALRERYGERFTELRYAPFDISLYDSTGTYLVQNANNLAVTITLPIPEALLAYGGNNKAGAVANGVLEDLAVQFTTIDGVPCMRFTATHFSPYVIYADTGNLVRGMTDVTPKTGDGIAPKWFLSAGMLSMSCVLFLWKDKKYLPEELAKAKEKKG